MNKLSDGAARIFDAMTGCPAYQVVAGGTAIDVASQKLPAPRDRGDEQWSQLLTFSTGGRSTVVKQTAVRDGHLLLIVSGSRPSSTATSTWHSPRPRQRADLPACRAASDPCGSEAAARYRSARWAARAACPGTQARTWPGCT